jgi:gamma-carbonic anhydrase
MDRAIVESGAMVAAGSLVAPRKVVKAGELWSGSPARCSRRLKPEELEYIRWVPGHYRKLAAEYRK